jgi:hypothetical protein
MKQIQNPVAIDSRTSLTSFAFYRDGNEPSHAVSDARYRYIRYSDGFEELYDLENDPNEFKNLANELDHAEIKSKLLKGIPKNAATNAGIPQNSPYHRGRRAK